MSLYFNNQVQQFLRLKFQKYLSKVEQQRATENRTFLGQSYTIAENPSLFAQNPALDSSRPAVVAPSGQVFQNIISGNPQPLDAVAALGTSNAVQIEEAYRAKDEEIGKSIFLLLNKPSEQTDAENFRVHVLYLYDATKSKICSLKAEVEDLITLANSHSRNWQNSAVLGACFANNKKNLVLHLSINAFDYDPFWNVRSNQAVGTVAVLYKNFKIVPDAINGGYKFGFSSKEIFNTIGSAFASLPSTQPGTTSTYGRTFDFSGVVHSISCSASSAFLYTLIPGSDQPQASASPVGGGDILVPQVQLFGDKLDLCFGFNSSASTGAAFVFDRYVASTGCPLPYSGEPDVVLGGRREYQKIIQSSSFGTASGLIVYPATDTEGEEVTTFEVPLVDASSYNNANQVGALIYENAAVTTSPIISLLATSSVAYSDAGCHSTTVVGAHSTTDETICFTGDPTYTYTDLVGSGLVINITDLRIFEGSKGKAAVMSVNYVTPFPIDGKSITTEMEDAAKSKTFLTVGDFSYENTAETFSNLHSSGNVIDQSDSKDVAPVVIFTDKLVFTDQNGFPAKFLQSSVIKPIDSYKFLGMNVPDVDGSVSYQKLSPQAAGPLMAYTGQENTSEYKFGPDIKSKIYANIYTVSPETGAVSSER
ncbi:MAG: hypothetical protein EKK48_29920 [Candidatus Melainabacteria bacterium]|nr:MAG: hypothetical protein EKK48_29920 [Candidatus Melainabacteria bacterium]